MTVARARGAARQRVEDASALPSGVMLGPKLWTVTSTFASPPLAVTVMGESALAY